MCGIFFSCSETEHQPPSDTLLNGLKRRGPDGVDSVSPIISLETTASRKSVSKLGKQTCFLTFLSTVLSMRGSSTVKQPLKDSESGSLLCWNGEAWKIEKQSIQGNDVEYVLKVFSNATKRQNDNADNTLASRNHSLQCVVDMLSSIIGPYAFIFHDAQHHRIFYGRDPLGRRSLLIKRFSNGNIVLSSICDPTESADWMEVEANGIYVIDLTAEVELSDGIDRITHIPWVIDQSKSILSCTLVLQTLLLLIYLRS